MKANPITMSLFKLLNERGIRYCVLRNYEELPESTASSDLDIYVTPCDHDAFTRTLADVCAETGARLVSYKADKMCPQYTLCAYLSGLQIDMYDGFANHRTCIYMDEDIITAYTFTTERGVKALRPEADGMMCFLKETLNNKRCRREYCEKASTAIAGKSQEVTDKILKAFSPSIRRMIVDTLIGKKFDDATIERVGRTASNDLQSFASRLRYRFGQLGKLARFARPLGYTVAFLGTDGSCKNTLINAIMPILSEAFHKGVYYEHLRPNYLPPKAVGERKPLGFLQSLFFLIYNWIDYTYGYLRKVWMDKSVKNHIWIFDGYFYDYLFAPQRTSIHLPKWLLRCFCVFVPKPDMIFCIGGG